MFVPLSPSSITEDAWLDVYFLQQSCNIRQFCLFSDNSAVKTDHETFCIPKLTCVGPIMHDGDIGEIIAASDLELQED